MNNEKLKNRVHEIYENIESLEKELKRLKKKCSHDSYRVGYYSWRIGSIDVTKLCNYCDKMLGKPSTEEIEKFNSENGFK